LAEILLLDRKVILMSLFGGRKMLLTSVAEVTKDNVADVIENIMEKHNDNVKEIEYLISYERGKQPILEREKQVRPEINEKIVTNIAHEIAEFKVDYIWGQPYTYVQRADKDVEDESTSLRDDTNVNALNKMFYEERKHSKDIKLAKQVCTTGVGYRMITQKDLVDGYSVFDITNLDPRTTFVVYSADPFHKKMLSGTYWKEERDGESGNLSMYHYTLYTDTKVFTLDAPWSIDNGFMRTNLTVEEYANGIGINPIVEYLYDEDRMGCFERAIPLLDAINVAESDRVNGLAQFVQSLIWMNNTEIDEDDYEALIQYGVIQTASKNGLNASIQYIQTVLNQTETQSLADDLYSKALEVCQVPARGSTGGGNTGVALMLGESGWQLAETDAQTREMYFIDSEIESLRVVKNIVERASESDIEEMQIADIEIKSNRNKISNLATKVSALSTMLSAGIHPRHAILNSDIFSDPEQVYLDSKPYLDNLYKTATDLEDEAADVGTDDITMPLDSEVDDGGLDGMPESTEAEPSQTDEPADGGSNPDEDKRNKKK
jgi:SPP1 family phage portal protein